MRGILFTCIGLLEMELALKILQMRGDEGMLYSMYVLIPLLVAGTIVLLRTASKHSPVRERRNRTS